MPFMLPFVLFEILMINFCFTVDICVLLEGVALVLSFKN